MLDKLNMVTKALLETGAIQSNLSAIHVESSAKDALAVLKDIAIHTAHRLRARSDEILHAYGIEHGENVLRAILERASKENEAIRAELGIGDEADIVETIRRLKQPSKNHGEFDEELVETLTLLFQRAWVENGQTRASLRDGTRAVLAELARMPCELPTDEQVQIAAYDIGNSDGVMTLEAASRRVAALFRDRVAPVIVAKDAHVAELAIALDGERNRANQASGRIAELEKQFAKTIEERDNARRELAARMALPAPVDADGKTPGQVFRDLVRSYTGVLPEHAPTWDGLRFTAQDDWEQAAKAFLRAFGPIMVRESLLELRTTFDSLDVVRMDFDYAKQVPFWSCKTILRVIDTEIAKLGLSSVLDLSPEAIAKVHELSDGPPRMCEGLREAVERQKTYGEATK